MQKYPNPTLVSAEIIWKDDKGQNTQDVTFCIGKSDENDPMDKHIFFYVDNMAEIESFKDQNNKEDFIVVSIGEN